MILTTAQKQQLLTRALQEEAFRAALQQDAQAAVRTALQLTLPTEYRLHVLQADPQRIVLVLPPYPTACPANAALATLLQHLQQRVPQGEGEQQRVIGGQMLLIAKAWHDAAYRQALLRDPKALVAQEFGAGLPAEVTMQVVAEDVHTQYLVLPPDLDDMELNDEQLEQVAGGELLASIVLSVVSVAGTAAGAAAAIAGW